MLGVITGIYRGTILTRTKSIAAEKAESKALSEARAAVERQRKGGKSPKVSKSRKRLVEEGKAGIEMCDEILDEREEESK